MDRKVLIIGASSSLGRKLSEKFFLEKYRVYATYNKNKKKLDRKKLYFTYKLNFLSIKSIKTFSKKIKNIKFDIILFVAAFIKEKNNLKNNKFGSINPRSLLNFFFINCLANIKLFEYLLKNKCIKKKGKVIFFSSLAGSIYYRGKLGHHKRFGNMSYRISKASLNSAVKNISYDLDRRGFIIISLHPGYVKSGHKNRNSNLSENLAIKHIYKTILSLKKKDHGRFINYNGKYLKW